MSETIEAIKKVLDALDIRSIDREVFRKIQETAQEWVDVHLHGHLMYVLLNCSIKFNFVGHLVLLAALKHCEGRSRWEWFKKRAAQSVLEAGIKEGRFWEPEGSQVVKDVKSEMENWLRSLLDDDKGAVPVATWLLDAYRFMFNKFQLSVPEPQSVPDEVINLDGC
jgi:hypothetical protein